ncbi:MAG: DUF4007 family protein [Acidobacteria bacterium]|nr:DUF4007 family protein [Acidobacteriota bacterium]
MQAEKRDTQISSKRLPSVSFSGHETFVFRHGWLKKAYDAVREDPRIFTRNEALVELGVGKNMVRSIRHWALATQVLQEEAGTRGTSLHPTQFGEFLFGGHDQYLEDPGSLWLLHWKLCTNGARCSTWSWALNMPTTRFTRESLLSRIYEGLGSQMGTQPSEHTLRRDVDCFLRTYVSPKMQDGVVLEDTLDCPLVELHLISERTPGEFEFRRAEQATLPPAIFVYGLLEFWGAFAKHRQTLAFSEIAYGLNGPGNIFKLDEHSLAHRLEQIEETTLGKIVYTATAGIQQVYRRESVNAFDLLGNYYVNSNPVVLGL